MGGWMWNREMKTTVLVTTAVVVLFAVAVVTVNYVVIEKPRRELAAGARVGMNRSEVIRDLGSPVHAVRSLKELHGIRDYAPAPPAPVNEQVLDYYRGYSWRMYVYIDKSDHVSKVVLSKT
jgi:hypothetical protein